MIKKSEKFYKILKLESEIKKLITEKYSLMEIADKLQLSYGLLYKYTINNIPEYNAKNIIGKSRKAKEYFKNSAFNISKEILEQLYLKEKLSVVNIGKKLNINSVTVFKYLKKYNIKTRLKNGENELYKPIIEKKILENLYINEKKSLYDIAKQLNYPNQAEVSRDMEYYKISRRNYIEAGKNLYKQKPEHAEKNRKRLRESREKWSNGSYRTWIEKLFEEWATEKGLKVKFQFQIKEYNHRYDFLIEDTNIIIELDGVHWHSGKQKIIDEWFDENAKKSGYNVYRFTDKDLKKKGKLLFEEVLNGKINFKKSEQ